MRLPLNECLNCGNKGAGICSCPCHQPPGAQAAMGKHEAINSKVEKKPSVKQDLSKCCAKPVRTECGEDFGGPDDIRTCHYECTQCEQPCDMLHEPGLPNAVICDIDGTLAHMKNRSPFEWHKVGTDVIDETIHVLLAQFCYGCFEAGFGHPKVILISGRDACCQKETEEWLERNEVHYDKLLMRPEGNNEKDSIIKERLYRENIEGKYNVLFVLDDRQQVVDMWRGLGLKCLQVAEGDF